MNSWWPLSLHEVLSLVGYEVVGVVARVSDALCLAENTRPDLAVVDVRLAGDRDGIEGAQLLQQLGIRTIFMTAEGDGETRQRASVADPAGFLLKPVQSSQLVQTIRKAVSDETKPRAASALPSFDS
jgi:DNA-binding NarL/FixJ family response regulator